MIIQIFIIIAVFVTPTFASDELLRKANPKSCFLFSWGKGPNWKTDISFEFHRHFLNFKRPYVDDQYSDATPKAFTWVDKAVEPSVSQIARVDGRVMLKVEYPVVGQFGRNIGCVMLAMETAPKSDWFTPFFVAQPELFKGRFVSSSSVRIGYVASLEFSGTGAFRTHYLFDLAGSHPSIVRTVSAGRVRAVDFDSDEAYQEALKVFDREAELLNGGLKVVGQAAVSDAKPDGDEKNKPESEGHPR